MLDSRFWDGAEWVCKTVRDTYLSVVQGFRVAWVSGVEAAQRDAAEALCEKEAEEEVAEPAEYSCPDCGPREREDFERCNYLYCKAMRTSDIGDYLIMAMAANASSGPLCACGHWLHPANVCAACGCNNVRLAPVAPAAVEDPVEAAPPAASTADSIKDILAQHYPTVTGRTVTCRCRLELGSLQQHWDHQADLIAGALKARNIEESK